MELANHRVRAVADRVAGALFVLALSAPLFDWCTGVDETPPLNENRVPAPLPAWPHGKDAIVNFTKGFDAYWNDHFGFRRRLIRWNAMSDYEFGASWVGLVAIGSRGFLFYTGEKSSESHQGLYPYKDADLDAWAKELESRKQFCERHGARFLFVIVPDKQSIYPEMLPHALAAGGQPLIDQWSAYMTAHTSVSFLDLRPALLKAKAEGQAYHRTDTHWTDLGAFEGYRAIVSRLAEWYPAMAPRRLDEFGRRRDGRWSGDLAMMMGIESFLAEPLNELVPPPLAVREVDDGPWRPPASHRFHVMEGRSRDLPRAVFINDSFMFPPELRNVPGKERTDPYIPHDSPFRLIALLGEQFSHAAFTWQRQWDTEVIEREHPDVVVEEVVERAMRADSEGAAPHS